jgi:hypothetical protein
MLEPLEDKRWIFVTGKGGVGKSTTVAALGRAFARRGDRTLVAETDAYSAMEALYDVDLADGTITQVESSLYTVKLDESDCFVDTLSRFVPSRRIVERLVDNRVARVFFDAAPGVHQFALLDQLREYLDRTADGEPRWDRILVDLPASGHAVTFLGVPQTFRELFKVGPIAERAGNLADAIADPERTAVCAVCLPEEMPVNETLELESQLWDRLDRGLTLAFANMVHRTPLAPSQRQTLDRLLADLDRDALLSSAITTHPSKQEVVERIIAGNILALDWHDRDTRYLDALHDDLRAPVVDIPVFYESDGDDVVERIADYMLGECEESFDTLAS